jgi:peptidoglycan/LPS O-acetylase OafA/YrhL
MRRLIIVALGLAATVVQSLWINERSVLSETLINHLQYFLVGFLLADVFLVEFGGRTGQNRGPGHGIWWDTVGVSAVLLTIWVLHRPDLARFITPALFFFVAASAFEGRAVRWAMSRPSVTAIGGMCYSIYLIHYQAISLFGRFTKDLPFSRYFWVNLLAQSIVVGLGVLALSAAFFLLVEKPCMRKDWPARLRAWFRSKIDTARARHAGAAR